MPETHALKSQHTEVCTFDAQIGVIYPIPWLPKPWTSFAPSFSAICRHSRCSKVRMLFIRLWPQSHGVRRKCSYRRVC